jgi:hypothetical protein
VDLRLSALKLARSAGWASARVPVRATQEAMQKTREETGKAAREEPAASAVAWE